MAAVIAIAGGALEGSGRRSPQTDRLAVRPLVGTPETTFEVKAPATYRLFSEGGPWENYHFILRGPGGRQCRGVLRSALGLQDRNNGFYIAHYRPARSDP